MDCPSYRICVGFFSVILLWHVMGANAQPGFLSIDCGGRANRTDSKTGIAWVTDDNFIDVGHKEDINASDLAFYQKEDTNASDVAFYQLQSRRVFSSPLNKSCYRLPLVQNVPHLFRLSFVAVNFSGSPISFNYSIEAVDMLHMINLEFNATKLLKSGERIFYSSGKVVYICLIRTLPNVDPFISAIELRKLKKGMYSKAKSKTLLRLQSRYDFGGQHTIRYPDDQFDRMWYPVRIEQTENTVSQQHVSINNAKDLAPTIVMQTAATVRTNVQYINFYLKASATKSLLLVYFAEIKSLGGSETRIIDAMINNELIYGNVSIPRNFYAIERQFEVSSSGMFTVMKAQNSTEGPIFNALEYYDLIDTEPPTSSKDVEALIDVKGRFGMTNWTSDPCFGLPWEGIHCVTMSSVIRVSSINLSRRHLTGTLPKTLGQLTELVNLSLANNYLTGRLPDLSTLKNLERLHLQNNNLSGDLPNWLSQLPNLKELFIQNNNFGGEVPQQLRDKISGGHINFTFTGGNKHLRIQPKRKLGFVVPLVTAGVTMITALILFLGIIIYRKKFRKKDIVKTGIRGRVSGSTGSRFSSGEDYSMVMVPNPSKSCAFTLDEMMAATENFTRKIGEGGFGSVFWGKLREGQEIAVKVLSAFSKQGVVEFLNEIDLLSRVHHKHLVSLLGYCNESRDLMLIYEHMPGGSLKDHLYGPNAEQYPKLDWKNRLKIALHSAQGLEYLHVGCTPKIIHRDIKAANILLDANMNGKLADFGLSRVTIDGDASHVTTTVKGTAGYLDPEYFSTQMLTEKSDVYSFGVVLLEILCGRRPIDVKLCEEEINLIRWVTPYMDAAEGFEKVSEIVDKRLGNLYNTKSIAYVAKLAVKCVGAEPSSRPSVSEVVAGIKEALQYDADSVEISDQLGVEYGEERHSIQISISDSSGPKERSSTENSSKSIHQEI